MNSAVLLGSALLIFILGYRFFGRFLSIQIFKPAYRVYAETDSTASVSQKLTSVPFEQWQYAAHHIAATVGVVSIVGVGIAATWGWAPAFLWIVTATVVAGGTFIIGALWLSRYRPETGAVEVIIDLLGKKPAAGIMALAFLLLLFLNPLLAMLISNILENYPAVTVPYLLHILLGMGLAYLFRQSSFRLRLATSIAVPILLCILIWGGTQIPFVIEGSLNLELAGFSFISIHSSVVWIALILFLVYASTLFSANAGSVSRAYTSTLMLMLLILVMIVAIFITHNDLQAPAYSSNTTLPFPLPLVFIIVTGGALCGFSALLAGGGSPMPSAMNHYRSGSAAYSGAIVDAVLAVGALIIATSGFTSEAAWQAQHSEWPTGKALGEWVFQFINGFAGLAGDILISGEFAAVFCAFILGSLALSTLETGIRIQCFMLEEIVQAVPVLRISSRRQIKIVVILVALIAVALSLDSSPMTYWISFGVVNQFFACSILLAIALALIKLNRSLLLVAIPLCFLIPITLWGALERLVSWWQSEHYGAIFVGFIILTIGCGAVALVGQVVISEYRSNKQAPETLL